MFKPILAAPLLKPEDKHDDNTIYKAMQKLKYPVICSLKKDGIRALRMSDCLRSRTLKLIHNNSIRNRAMILPYGFDMELWNPNIQYDEIQSIVMSQEHPKSDEIEFHVLDNFNLEQATYSQRLWHIAKDSHCFKECPFLYYEYSYCNNEDELFKQFIIYEQAHGEGICFRTPDSPYKQGRSTLKEQYLVKLCRHITEEATIIGFEEQLCNTNSVKRNSLGNMARSSFNSGMKGKGVLGVFLVRNGHGIEYRVGTGVGLTDAKRLEIWLSREKYLGKEIVVKSKAHGIKIKPRMPIYCGLREKGF